MPANVAKGFVAELAAQQHGQPMLEKWGTVRRRFDRHLNFTQNADCPFLDKRGLLRPGNKLRLVDDDLLVVDTSRYQKKYRQVSDVYSFDLEHCDRLAVLVDVPVLEDAVSMVASAKDAKGTKLSAQDLLAMAHAHLSTCGGPNSKLKSAM